MRERFRALEDWADALSLRERIVLLAALAVTLFVLWDSVLMAGPSATRRRVGEELETARLRVDGLRTQRETLTQAATTDPNERVLAEREALRAQLAELDTALSERTADLVPPAEMPRVLKDLVSAEPGVRLVRLEALPVQPVVGIGTTASDGDADTDASSAAEAEHGTRGAPAALLYKHGLLLELRGDYMSTLRYLSAVEQLRWRLLWDRITYEVDGYPEARVVLIVHSLSTEESWIGV